MIIGFTANTSKILPRMICKAPRHCAPIICVKKSYYIMYQFVSRGNVAQIALSKRALKILKYNGWKFVRVNNQKATNIASYAQHSKSCVDLCKHALKLRAPFVVTPRALYKKLKRP